MSTANLRDGWTVRSLESIAEEVIRRVPDPRTSGLDRFVSSSCIDRHDVRVTRWEATSEVVSAAKRFESGDYLLVRRSLYATDFRERAPRADFAGVCSADILTIRERQGELAPGFLQYLLYDKGFWDFIVANSTGSITRRIKWRQIAKYEFALPPLGEQQRIVEVLVSADLAMGEVAKALQVCADLERAVVSERVWSTDRPLRPIRDVWSGAQFFDGDWIESKDQASAGVRLLQLADIGVGQFLDKSSRFVSDETFERLRCHEVLEGDFLVSRMADPIGRTCVVPSLAHRLITVVDACVIRPPTMSTHECCYWLALLNSAEWTRACERAAGGTTRTRVSRSKLEVLRIPDLTLSERIEVGVTLDGIAQLRDALRQEEAGCQVLARSLREAAMRGVDHVQ